ncbi:hypothetical protein G9A89_012681 [Geosiphon pyriformis]|nr:hypothetical protein G9A89_008048 [Geosiphon pyriformis]KAG9301297.1 hypothetical protein G9A89_012681 [Geosiphon pyriformis]
MSIVERSYPLWVHVLETTKNGSPLPNTTADLVYWKDLDNQNDKASGTTCRALHVARFCPIKDFGMICLAEEKHVMKLVSTPY